MKEPTIVSPPIEMKTLVCGAGMEESFEEVGRGAVVFMKSLGMISPGVRFLDVGCGCGRVARFLLDEPLAEYVGFDRNSNMIDWCNEYLAPADSRFTFEFFSIRTPYENLDGIGGDVTATQFAFPYDDGRFDSILLTSVFSHMELGEIDHYLRELRRVLALGGRILASVLFAETDPYDNVTDFWHRPDDIIGLLDKRGFRWTELGARRFGGHQSYFLLQHRQALEGA